jgi:hypothetical protein
MTITIAITDTRIVRILTAAVVSKPITMAHAAAMVTEDIRIEKGRDNVMTGTKIVGIGVNA